MPPLVLALWEPGTGSQGPQRQRMIHSQSWNCLPETVLGISGGDGRWKIGDREDFLAGVRGGRGVYFVFWRKHIGDLVYALSKWVLDPNSSQKSRT